MNNLTLILPEIIIALIAIIILLSGSLFREKFEKLSGYFAFFGIFMAIATLLLISKEGSYQTINLLEGITIAYSFDLFAIVFKLIFLSVALLSVMASLKYMENSKHLEAYYSLILVATLGMMVVASAGDLLTLFVGIETAAIPAFVLAAFEFNKKGLYGALKYFLFGAIFSVILLFGIALIYAGTGSLMISELTTVSDTAKFAVFIGIMALFAGLAFEMSAVPFHAWAPAAYEGAPAPVGALLAGASKKMAFAAALKILAVAVILFKVELSIMIAILAIFSMIIGNILALGQKDVKRMLAYSSIAQVGYILAAIAIFTPAGIAYAIYYIIVHAFMKGGAFIAVASTHISSGGKIKNYEDYIGLTQKMPITAFAMTAFLLSLAGIVPFGGFTAKILILFEIFVQAMQENTIALILGVVMVVTSVISLYYYGRMIKYMWFVKVPEKEKNVKYKENFAFILPMIIAVVALIILFYAPPFVEICMEIATGPGF
ncbi:MAG: dehydrogenase [Candidatus Altiarchaeales archaeon HGW-Altiarchaeales-3]|nr:MAG: dehydrogenase [Candidatus Altiarchaeales archaeon HGW-Altiarchaeales-3]